MNVKALSATVGWIYVLFWGLCNYPTLISNIKLKSIQGISIDYLFFNGMGFSLYTMYTSAMYFSSLVREEFKLSNGQYPLIKLNDVVFGSHNLVVNMVILSQAYVWGFKKNDNQYLSGLGMIILGITFGYVVIGAGYIYMKDGFEPVENEFNWVYLFTSFGLVKILMSICKNIPQIIYNYNRKSTHGWPILMIWLDFLGGFLSFVQLIIDAYSVGDMYAMLDNLPKLLLAIEVFIADAIFFWQHYYLYANSDLAKYGPTKSYSAVEEDEEFVVEHSHDHDHRAESFCHTPMDPTDGSELQRLLSG